MRATTPQQAIAGNRAAMIIMGIVPPALLVAIGWAIWTGGTHPFILALMSYLILVLVWMTVNLIDLNRVYRGQIAPGGGHHCVCAECGRMGSPTGPASPPTWMRSTPFELGLRWRPVMGALGFAPLLAFIHFLTVMLAPGDEGFRAAMSDPAGHILRISLVVLPPIGIWLIFRHLKRLGERADALPPTHGCTCRWCGTPPSPDQFPLLPNCPSGSGTRAPSRARIAAGNPAEGHLPSAAPKRQVGARRWGATGPPSSVPGPTGWASIG